MSQNPPPPPSASGLKPHRGATVLTLGILALVLSGCAPVSVVLGIIAINMGGNDLRAMDLNHMDADGRGLTQAGRICGIIGVILGGLALLLWIFYLLIAVAAVATGA